MDLKKYSTLRNKIKNRDFEQKYSKLDQFLFYFSWGGNAGSIFFAYFLVFPAFLNAISANLESANIATLIASIITIIVLGVFEVIKRQVLHNFSFDFVKNKFKITKKTFGWFLFSMALISASFYFSLNGAKNFANTSKKQNLVVEKSIDVEIDSLTQLYTEYKQPFIDDNASLREFNVGLRNKMIDTPLNYRIIRKELQNNIDKNLATIESNDEKIKAFDSELGGKIASLENDLEEKKNENNDEDVKNILVFLIISTSIELIIILGVYFREYYDYTRYLNKSSELEEIMIKRDRYNTLLKFLFKEGSVGQGEKIMGVNKLKEVVSERSSIPSPKKFVDDFIADVTYMGILRLEGTRRYTAVTYEEAVERVEKFDDTFRLLEKLK